MVLLLRITSQKVELWLLLRPTGWHLIHLQCFGDNNEVLLGFTHVSHFIMKGKSSTVMEKSEKTEEEDNHPDVDVKSESSLRRLTLGRACSLTPSTSLQSEQSDPQLTSITMLVCKLNILLTKFVCSKTSHGFKWGQFYPSPKVFYTNAIRDKLQVLQALVRSPFRSSFPKLPAMS